MEWTVKKFYDKLDEIKEALDNYNEGLESANPGDDPLNETSEPIQLGIAYYKLEGLAYMMDNPATVSIVAKDSKIVGKLEVNIVPCCEDGDIEIPEEMIPENPEDIIGSRIDFYVEIKRAFDLPDDFCKDIFCKYVLYIGEEEFATQPVLGKNHTPEFNYRYQHTIEPVSERFIKYLNEDSVSFPFYAISFSYVLRFTGSLTSRPRLSRLKRHLRRPKAPRLRSQRKKYQLIYPRLAHGRITTPP